MFVAPTARFRKDHKTRLYKVDQTKQPSLRLHKGTIHKAPRSVRRNNSRLRETATTHVGKGIGGENLEGIARAQRAQRTVSPAVLIRNHDVSLGQGTASLFRT